jgi:hypothetical protein
MPGQLCHVAEPGMERRSERSLYGWKIKSVLYILNRFNYISAQPKKQGKNHYHQYVANFPPLHTEG